MRGLAFFLGWAIRPVWEEEDAKVEVAVEAAGWEEVEEEAKEAEEAEEEPPPPPVEPPKPTIPPPKLFVQQLSGDGYADLVRHWPPSEDHLDGAASLSAQCEGGMTISDVMKTVDLAMMAYPPPASSTSRCSTVTRAQSWSSIDHIRRPFRQRSGLDSRARWRRENRSAAGGGGGEY